MSKLSKGLEKSSRIYNSGGENSFQINGTGTTAWVCVLKQPGRVKVKSLAFNGNAGAAGEYSIAVIPRGYNSEAGGRKVSQLGTAVVPAVQSLDNDWDLINPDRTQVGNQPTATHVKAFEIGTLVDEIHRLTGNPHVYALEPYDELWIKALANTNYTIIWE